MNTLLDEATSLSKSPIWNNTVPLGEPVAPVFVAERLTVDEGQNHPEFGEGQSGIELADEEGKSSPLDPVSIKLL